MRKYGESKTTRIMTATVPHVTSGLGLRKFQADGVLLTRVYSLQAAFTFRTARTGSLKQQGVANFRRNLRYCLLTAQGTADPKLRRLNLRPF